MLQAERTGVPRWQQAGAKPANEDNICDNRWCAHGGMLSEACVATHQTPYPSRAHLAEVDGLDARDDLPDVRLRAAGHTRCRPLRQPLADREHVGSWAGNSAVAAATLCLGGAVPARRRWLSLGAE
jgi:hypothetical protein